MKRKDLYQLVWSSPISKISNDYDLPLDQIRKICKEYKIPLPKQGYWKKLEYGKAGDRPSLPEFKGDNLIDLNEIRKEYENSYSFKLLKRTKEIQEQHLQLSEVSDRLTKPHLLVEKARSDLNKKRAYKTNGYDQSVSTSIGYISISVSKGNVPRILRFINAFIKLLESRGHELFIEHNETKIRINEESIPIFFREKCNRKSVDTNSWSYSILVPNGKLSIKISKPYSSTEWVEGSVSIEEQLPKILAALELYAENEKRERDRIKKYWEEQRSIQKIKDDEMAKQRFEEEKIQILLNHADEWRKTNDLKMFIDQVEQNYEDSESNNGICDWINWARNVCKTIDPISCNVDSFLDQYDYEKSKILKRDLSKR